METRAYLENARLRLDFDRRTSDTMYNYIWVRNPLSGELERVYNFGCDIAATMRDSGQLENTIGVRLDLEKRTAGQHEELVVQYPSPLFRYAQVADATTMESILNYPDLPEDFGSRMRVADGEASVHYEIDPQLASFRTWATDRSGKLTWANFIVNALWVENPHVPRTVYLDGLESFDGRRTPALRELTTRDVRYLIFYNRDGSGLPFAVVIEGHHPQRIWPYYASVEWPRRCHFASTNQAFRPRTELIAQDGFNDVNLPTDYGADRRTPSVVWAFFPELGWGQGGEGDDLLARLQDRLEAEHLGWWLGVSREASVEMRLRQG